MLRPLQRILRVKFCAAFVSSMYSQMTLLSNSASSPPAVSQAYRHLAERRNLQEPVRLVGKIDIDPLERNALFGKRDHRALHIGTKLVADQSEFLRHDDLLGEGQAGLAPCTCIYALRDVRSTPLAILARRIIVAAAPGIGMLIFGLHLPADR